MNKTRRIKSKRLTKSRKSSKSKGSRKNKTFKHVDPYKKTDLYPKAPIIKEYTMKVSKLHTIAYSTYGNPSGKPVLYVHGGPGGGTDENMARFFNPKKYYIVLVDQRGCGKSKPSAELRENNTKNLITDFEKIRKSLQIKKWMVYGGSWGSTLSLAYAFEHPSRTTELILRGIFFCTDDEVHWLSEPKGAEFIRPDGWKYFMEQIKHKKSKGLFINEYKKCFKGKYGKQRKEKCLLAWSVWEAAMSNLNMKPIEQLIREVKTEKYHEMSAIELHYFKKNCFFKPNTFLEKSNLNKIRNIPVVIVQGIYDLVCPYFTAYKLHNALPHSKIYPTMAGHSAMETDNIKHLVKITDEYADS